MAQVLSSQQAETQSSSIRNMDMFSVLFPSTAAQLDTIQQNQEALMASYNEVKKSWVDYTTQLQDENASLRTALTQAQQTAQDNANALADFQNDDAATDASQLQEQEQRFADDLQKALDDVKAPKLPPEQLPEGPPGSEPHPDQTLPGDLPPDEPSGPTQAPEGEEPQVNPLKKGRK